MREHPEQVVVKMAHQARRHLCKAGVFGLVIVALMVVDVRWIVRGVNPYSLWLDDQWVAALVQHATFAQVIGFMPPAPIGFVMLLKAVAGAFGEGHAQLQAVAIVCGMLQIALMGCVAWRATGSMSLGLTAAILLSGSRMLMVCSLRVKQYTLEGVVVLILIGLAVECVRRPRPAFFLLVIAAACVSLGFSFTAIAVGLVIVNVLGMHLASRDLPVRMSRRLIVGGCAAYDMIAVAWLLIVQSHQANGLMFEFWRWHYAPTHDLSLLWQFARGHMFNALVGALPHGLGWLATVVPVSVIALLFNRPTRLIGFAFVLFYFGMLALSAMGKYPIGGGRTDVFSYPITILAIIGGIWRLSRVVPMASLAALACVGLYAALTFPGAPVDYPRTAGRGAIEEFERLAGDDDGLIIPPNSSWVFGCYGSSRVELIAADDSSNRFLVRPTRPHTLLVRETSQSDAALLDERLAAQLEAYLDAAPGRIWYVSVHAWQRPDEVLTQRIEARGYRRQVMPTADGSVLLMFQRIGDSDEPRSAGGA